MTATLTKKIVYIDMDGVLCDFDAGYQVYRERYPEVAFPQSIEGCFLDLNPIPGAIDAYNTLAGDSRLDIFILSAPSVINPACYTEKRLWVEQHLGLNAAYRLILNPHKNLQLGDYLIDDDADGKGQDAFQGRLLHFGSEQFPHWSSVLDYFQRCLQV